MDSLPDVLEMFLDRMLLFGWLLFSLFRYTEPIMDWLGYFEDENMETKEGWDEIGSEAEDSEDIVDEEEHDDGEIDGLDIEDIKDNEKTEGTELTLILIKN